MAVYHKYLGFPRQPTRGRALQQGSYFGPSFSAYEIRAFLDGEGLAYRELDPSERADEVARLIADGKIVGHFSGRMEFGPRALGARSILGDARRNDTQSRMNLKIKHRESFRLTYE